MSKISQIQKGLKAIDPAAFQQLCDLYLHRKGYTNINPIGLVIGSNKVTTGTPDSLIKLNNGKYLFAEYTTQESGVFAKFKDDLEKCFNVDKTSIPIEEIEEIVLCHTTKFSTKEEYELTEICRDKGCRLTVFGIGAISYDLYQKYPGLAKEFLGIEVDTHQIVEPNEFIFEYNKRSLATPLDTIFQFREEEVRKIIDAISDCDLVIITGRPGVGKSRLALESSERFVKEHPEWSTWCIFNRGQNLYDDLQVYFSPDGNYLIFVDDANRINFDYVLQLLHSQSSEKKIKIIATVRDYALTKVRDTTYSYGSKWEIEIQPFNSEQISDLVKLQYKIHNHLYLERIAFISAGNPRLAMMAAQVAVNQNTLQSIRDVSQLYEVYFRSIRNDLASLNNKNIVQVAGIIAFFRTVDRSNEILMQEIVQAFKISESEFWLAAIQLHEIEVVDMYEDEVVRISDQVLSTYLFYLAFFQENTNSFEIIINHFFSQFSWRIIDSLYPVINSFDDAKIIEVLKPQVARYWLNMSELGINDDIFEFMRIFWFVDKTGNLRIIRDLINGLEPEIVDWSDSIFKPDNQTKTPPIPEILRLFQNSEFDSLRMALELLLNYAEKRWNDIPVILYILQSDFGYTHRSHYNGYLVQNEVISALKRRIEMKVSRIYPYMFFAVAEYLLKVGFTHHESRDHQTVHVYEFQLYASTELLGLRSVIWKTLFALYEETEFSFHVMNVIKSYISSNGEYGETEIISYETGDLIPFIETRLHTQEYTHCLLVHDYCNLLKRRHVQFNEELIQQFYHGNLVLRQLLFDSLHDMAKMGFDEYFIKKKENIKEHFKEFKLPDYIKFFMQCEEIVSAKNQNDNIFVFEQNIANVLIDIADKDELTYRLVISYLLQQHNKLQLEPWFIVPRLVLAVGTENTWNILTESEYSRKHKWLFNFYINLQENEITSLHIIRLILLYKDAAPEDIPSDWQYIAKFQKIDQNVYMSIIRILVERARENKRFSHIFHGITERKDGLDIKLLRILANNLDLLKQVYFTALEITDYFDYRGSLLNFILDIDKTFARDYFHWIATSYKRYLNIYHHREYAFLWMRDDYNVVITEIIESANASGLPYFFIEGPLTLFFVQRSDKKDVYIENRQDELLSDLISRRGREISLMQLIFDVVSGFSYDRRKRLISDFVKSNNEFSDFKKLSLEPRGFSWTGSQVPMLEGRVVFYQSLLPLFDSIDLLDHRQEIEMQIQYLRREIEREKKRDFMENS
ncbi:MAG TPA: hypothetical protein VFS21_07150 [Roseiflexaceae bacterium]|nr:hypothetical protein [Roseiflexaceae bacterium]